ncbi:MAG: YciI family protein [Steroidobacteraceae bacterium]
MTYMLLVVEKAGERSARSEQEGRGVYDRMLSFSEDLERRGLLTMSQSLRSEALAARVTRRGEKPIVRDGPFAEAKETIGGFFLLTCDTREQAIEIARECPATEWATIEVRELGPCYR